MRDALITGSIAGVVVLAAAALCGAARNRSAVAPVNAISHVLWGDEETARAQAADVKHTLPGVVINEGASVFWASIYERAFGHAASRGAWPVALAGGAAVSALAYLVDYHLVSKRLTPGWELHLDRKSLAWIYGALALSLPARGLFEAWRARAGGDPASGPKRA